MANIQICGFMPDKVQKKILPSMEKLVKVVQKINNTNLTFGVHSEDNYANSDRKALSEKPLHKALYGNKAQNNIGNAELLAKHEKGFSSAIFINGKENPIIVPPRPVLQPVLKILLSKKNTYSKIKSGLKQDLSFKSITGTINSFFSISSNLGTKEVFKFIEKRGLNYWTEKAKHNNPYVSAIKTVETLTLGQGNTSSIYDEKTKKIKYLSKSENSILTKVGDKPLLDSLDLVNSIKSEVNW